MSKLKTKFYRKRTTETGANTLLNKVKNQCAKHLYKESTWVNSESHGNDMVELVAKGYAYEAFKRVTEEIKNVSDQFWDKNINSLDYPLSAEELKEIVEIYKSIVYPENPYRP